MRPCSWLMCPLEGAPFQKDLPGRCIPLCTMPSASSFRGGSWGHRVFGALGIPIPWSSWSLGLSMQRIPDWTTKGQCLYFCYGWSLDFQGIFGTLNPQWLCENSSEKTNIYLSQVSIKQCVDCVVTLLFQNTPNTKSSKYLLMRCFGGANTYSQCICKTRVRSLSHEFPPPTHLVHGDQTNSCDRCAVEKIPAVGP